MSKKLKKTTLFIQGMHCPSCDVLVKSKFSELSNIKEVIPNYQKQEAEVIYKGHLDKHALNDKVRDYGYVVTDRKIYEPQEPFLSRISTAGVIAVVLFILYFFAQELKLLPDFNTTAGSSITYMTVLVLGLVASTSTCMATSGALFLSTVGKLNRGAAFTDNVLPAISFNVGRVLSYGLFGFIAGMLGKTAAQNLQLGSLLTLFVSLFMILIGLNMAKLISFSFLSGNSLTKGLFETLESKLIQSPKKTSFFLGAITYFLPCGFTQSVQLYALGLADPLQSALIMMIFAIGTIPALLAVGFASSLTKSPHYALFARTMGVLVFIIGISYFSNFLTLRGININPTEIISTSGSTVPVKDGYQEIKMNVNSSGYTPNNFTVKSGVPVKWIMNGENVFGCQGLVLAPKLGMQKTLEKGENTYEFTPTEKGPIVFSCSMGMFRGLINVI